jgi:hypothetical protein
MGWNGKNKPAMIFGMIVLGVGFVFGLIWVVMALWNWLMPAIFDISEITYWQAAGLLLLSKILFGGFCHKKKCGGHHCGGHHKGGHWKHKFKHKWGSMSEEDKRKWEEKFGKGCGFPKTEEKPSAETEVATEA